MAKYIARGGELAWTGPSMHTNVIMDVFAVRADSALVHQMLTRCLDEPSGDLGLHVDVRGTSIAYVLFVFLDSKRRQIPRPDEKGRIGDDERRFKGAHPERTFAVLALGYRSRPNPGWVLFTPYDFASDTPGWQAEREIYGSTRQQGDVAIRSGSGEWSMAASCSVAAAAIKRFGPGEVAKRQRILSIRKTSNAKARPIPPGAVAAQIEAALGGSGATLFPRSPVRIVPETRLGSTAADESFFERGPAGSRRQASDDITLPLPSLGEALASGSLPMLYLKQFRDVAFADRACYQAIVEAPFHLGQSVRAMTSNDYELYLEDIDSAPIGRELGIPTGRAVPVEAAFRVRLDTLRVGDARVISNPDWNPADEFSTPDEPSRLPRYVDRGGEAVWRQPSLLYGATIYGFGVTVPLERQLALLKKMINEVVESSDSTYGSKKFSLRPCTGVDMVMLLFVEYERITSANAGDEKLGASTYREFLVSQLAISDDPEFPELDWFIPYICLDADAPRLCGREIFGYPKQLSGFSEFDLFEAPKGTLAPVKKIKVNTTVFSRSESAEAKGHEIVSVRVNGPRPAITPYQNAQDLFIDLFRGVVPRPKDVSVAGRVFPFQASVQGVGVDVLNALLMNRVGDVFLKEFRDAQDPQSACYQAVCKTDMMPVRFHGGGRIDDPSRYRIQVEDIASEPLRLYLEDASKSGSISLTPRFAFGLNLDLELTVGRVIANPLAKDRSRNVSLKRTAAEVSASPRPPVRRVPSFTEPYWAR